MTLNPSRVLNLFVAGLAVAVALRWWDKATGVRP